MNYLSWPELRDTRELGLTLLVIVWLIALVVMVAGNRGGRKP